MPGPPFTEAEWEQYEALRKKGYSKESAARIVNYQKRKRKEKKNDKARGN